MTDELSALARLYNVQTSYNDAQGRPRQANPDSVRAALAALGAEVADPVGALRRERLRRHRQTVEPVVAVPATGVQTVAVTLPRAVHPRDCWLSIEPESGNPVRTRLMPALHRPLGSASLEGLAVDRYEARVGSASQSLPPGYYRLRAEGPGVEGSSLLVVAPRCPVPERSWGGFLPVHALRTDSDWGVGSYSALRELGRWLGSHGAGMVGVLPLYPMLIDDPRAASAGGGWRRREEVSPYLPASRLAWNELYVDVTALPELEAAPRARELLESADFRAEVAAVRRSALVDYPASMALVRRALEPLSRALFSGPSRRRDELETFARAHPEVVAYARFRAGLPVERTADGPLSATAEGPGARAPEEQGAPDTERADAVAAADAIAAADADVGAGAEPVDPEGAFRYYLYAQWAAAQQIAAVGEFLYLDMPVGTHPDGFDPCWEPDVFAQGVEGGAPPDTFYARGQRWGFRPLHPMALREQEYRHYVGMLRHVMSQAKVLRLDHVMGLYRLYWVPEGAEATDGVYVGYPHHELRAITCLEAQRSGTAVVGEDLGTVPEEVHQGMSRDRMLRSWVLEFEVSADDPLPEPPPLVLASVSTHDLPRFSTFWAASEQAGWRKALGGDARHALHVSLGHLARSPARLVMVDVEDLWLERWPHNRPGTGPEAGNWRHRAARTFEEMREDVDVAGLLRDVDAARRDEEKR